MPIGCNSLTKRMWIENKMVNQEFLLFKTYQENKNSNKRYIQLKSGKTVELEIIKNKDDWGKQIYDKDISGKLDVAPIYINDFSKVPLGLRETSSFSYLIFPEKKTYGEKNILITSNYFQFKSQSLDQLPQGLSKYPYKECILVSYWKGNRGIWPVTWRIIATPFTCIADIIIIPWCYIYGYSDMWSNFPH